MKSPLFYKPPSSCWHNFAHGPANTDHWEGGELTFPYNRVQSHVIVLLQLLTLSSPFSSLIRALVFRLS